MNLKRWSALVAVVFLAGLASACVDIGVNVVIGSNVVGTCMPFFEVTNFYPPNNAQYGYAQIGLQCNFTGTNLTQMRDVFVNVWGSSSTGFQNTSDCTNGTRTFTFNFTANNRYNWSCGADFGNNTVLNSANGNFTFNVSVASVNPIVGGGNCQTDSAYYYIMQATSENYVLVNLSVLSSQGYCFDANCSNVWVQGGSSYNFGNNNKSILVDTSTIKQFVVWVGSFGRTVNRTSSSAAYQSSRLLQIENFTQASPSYLINVLDEITGNPWNFSVSNAMSLDIYCMTYAVERLDLKAWNRNTLFISTKEIPYIFAAVGNITYLVPVNATFNSSYADVVNRKYMPSSNLESFNLYFLPQSYPTCTFNFFLADYTGDFQFPNAYLTIQSNVNNTIQTIWKERWAGLAVSNVQLQANDYYKTQVTSGDSMRDISWFIAQCNSSSLTLTITNPSIPAPKDFYSKAQLGFTGDFNSASLGFAYNVSDGKVSSSSFKVQLQNASGLYTIYTSSINGYTAGAFSTPVPAVNTTYLVEGVVNSSTYGNMVIRGIYSLWNGTARYVGFPSLEPTILGETQQTVLNGLSMVALTFGAFMFGAFYSGFGGLFVAFGGALLYWLNFLDVPWTLILFINVLAALNFWTAERGR